MFQQIEDFQVISKRIRENKGDFYQNKPAKYYTTRYCSQNMYNTLLGGGWVNGGYSKRLKLVGGKNSPTFEVLPQMTKPLIFIIQVTYK